MSIYSIIHGSFAWFLRPTAFFTRSFTADIDKEAYVRTGYAITSIIEHFEVKHQKE